VVSKVGTVATAPSADDKPTGSSTQATVTVEITPSDPKATGVLDSAPVQVAITTATAKDALVVPVTALLALAGGGYAVEAVDSAGTHSLVAVTTGLFDDAQGLVQVDGDLTPGMRVVVPGQ
jgi:multidrug efflux pump subunit AcrA (membrane-fusion protein)